MSKTTIYIPVPCDGKELPERWPKNNIITKCIDVLWYGEKTKAYYNYKNKSWSKMRDGFIFTPSHWYKAVEVDSDGLDALVKKSLEEEKIKRMAADECKRGNRMWE